MAWKQNFTKIFTYRRGGRLSPCPGDVDITYVQAG